ncbi:MAG: FAD:protein FMN transferase [Defluviitaleaceae bacterium]|nr:FAD:protein FMN transferase [Defluviitaleaceae bacterium]
MRRFFGLCMLLVCLVVLGGCDIMLPQRQYVATQRAIAMDTLAQVHIFYMDTPSQPRREHYMNLAQQAMDIVHELDELLNMHREGSDIWRINQAGGGYVEVSDHTVAVLEQSLHMRRLSAGAFDITIGAVTALWDFAAGAVPPDGELIAAALETVGTEVHINGNMVRLGHPHAKIDLGAVGKGFAADAAAEFLRGYGVAALVDLGGDIATIGAKPDGTPWSVGIQDPFAGPGELIDTIEIGETGVASSGAYRRYFYYDDIRFHHILDPATGFPVDNDIIAVNIIAPDATWSEGISTAVYVMGAQRGMALIESLTDVRGIIILRDGTVLTIYEHSF